MKDDIEKGVHGCDEGALDKHKSSPESTRSEDNQLEGLFGKSSKQKHVSIASRDTTLKWYSRTHKSMPVFTNPIIHTFPC